MTAGGWWPRRSNRRTRSGCAGRNCGPGRASTAYAGALSRGGASREMIASCSASSNMVPMAGGARPACRPRAAMPPSAGVTSTDSAAACWFTGARIEAEKDKPGRPDPGSGGGLDGSRLSGSPSLDGNIILDLYHRKGRPPGRAGKGPDWKFRYPGA